MTNLVSDLFILLSVHPMWVEDGVGLPYQYDGDARRKTENSKTLLRRTTGT